MLQDCYDHIFSAVKDTPLNKIIEPSSRGLSIGFAMKDVDFNQITSAEI